MHRIGSHRATRLARRPLPAVALMAGLTLGTAQAAEDQTDQDGEAPFKISTIIFEANASACDLGIQIAFDTEGIVEGTVENPDDRPIHEIRAKAGLRAIGGQTEGFLEGVEPQIQELIDAAPDCERVEEEPLVELGEIRKDFPAGVYKFEGTMADGSELKDQATLTYDIPAGPVLGPPNGADHVSPFRTVIRWQPVTTSIPGVFPEHAVNVVAYQVIVYEDGVVEPPPEFNVVVPACGESRLPRCAVTVSPQFLKRGTPYLYEVLAIEESGNQTLTEGSFETRP